MSRCHIKHLGLCPSGTSGKWHETHLELFCLKGQGRRDICLPSLIGLGEEGSLVFNPGQLWWAPSRAERSLQSDSHSCLGQDRRTGSQ